MTLSNWLRWLKRPLAGALASLALTSSVFAQDFAQDSSFLATTPERSQLPFSPGDVPYDAPATDIEGRMRAMEGVIRAQAARQRELEEQLTYHTMANNEMMSANNMTLNERIPHPVSLPPEDKTQKKKWYEKLSLRGYAQFRINEVMDEDAGSFPAQHVGDRSVGEHQNFLIRRARVIISGDVSDHVYVYLQPDFASSVPGSSDANQFCQIRDWYADCYLWTDKVHRIRVGQSKVPYGWENMQSSSNRLALDRNDGINSAVRNERDLGLFYYWTPEDAQLFYKEVIDQGLKGSGNYGVFGMGIYNGQGGSLQEQNDSLHFVTRLNVPHIFESGQRIEAGVQGYTGYYTVLSSAISPLGVGPAERPLGTLETDNRSGILDQRLAASFIYYPQPWGFQAEWNVGRGPGLNDAQTEVIERHLYGGYVQTMYMYDTDCYGLFIPFVKYNRFKGGYKPERNAPFASVDETEFGLEWQITRSMELTSMYVLTNRTNTVANGDDDTLSYGQFKGDLLRFQFQVNY
jgi:hypothetical protein